VPSSIAFVQAVEGYTEAGSTLKVTVPGALGAHNTLIVGFQADLNATVKSITDTLGNTFVPVAGPANDADENAYIYAAYDLKPGSDAVTIVVVGDGPADDFGATIAEYSGLAADGVNTATTTTGTSKVTDGAKMSLTTTKPNVLLYGFFYGSTASGNGTMVAGTNFSRRVTGDGMVAEDEIVATAGTYPVTATMTTGEGYIALSAAFAGK
jgi:hypothetical protein